MKMLEQKNLLKITGKRKIKFFVGKFLLLENFRLIPHNCPNFAISIS